jgi:hypothetical protein
MPEEKKLSLYQEQKAIKPLIEDIIPEYLNGDAKSRALNFAAYMRENKMKPMWGGVVNSWKAVYKSKPICVIQMRKNHWKDKYSWVLILNLKHMNEYEETIMNEDLQYTIWDNLFYCGGCHIPPCNKKNFIILDKEVQGICGGTYLFVRFGDPDEATINSIKRLLELEQQAREN